MRSIEPIITRLERAGGAVSEAVERAERSCVSAPVVNKLVSINIALGDARRALVRLEHGDDPDEVSRDLEQLLREAFE